MAVLECSENLILDVFYSQDGAVFAVGDTGVSVIQSGDASKVDYTFDGYSLAGYSLYGNRAALALQAYDTGGTGKLVVLDNTGSVFAELSTGDNITGISLFGDTLAVLYRRAGQRLFGQCPAQPGYYGQRDRGAFRNAGMRGATPGP